MDKQGKTVDSVSTKNYAGDDWNGWEDVTLTAYAPVDNRIVWMPATTFDEETYLYYGKVGLLDANDNVILEPTYDDYRYSLDGTFFHSGLMVVVKDDKFGAIDINGKEVIPCEYDYMEVFDDGYTFVIKEDVGYILDITGKLFEITGVNGVKTKITACSSFNDDNIAVVYDAISKSAFCIKYDAKLGSAYAIPGTENLDISTFIPDYDGDMDAITYVRGIGDDLIPYEENGKWGYMRLTLSDAAAAPKFADVPAGEYYAQPVEWAVANKITNGMTETTFGPDATCTRGQILTFLYRAAGSPEVPDYDNIYANVKESDYFYKPMMWAMSCGMISSDPNLDPNAPCTRMEAVYYMWAYAGRTKSSTVLPFTDAGNNAENVQAIAWALDNGVTTGTSATTFSPENNCTLGQIVTFLWRAYAK